MSYDVRDQVALVTGANRGIGKAITETLLNHGASKVYAAVRNLDSATSLIEQHGSKIVPLELDLTKPETINAAANTASDVTLVINNAGVLRTVSALSEDVFAALEYELETNLFGLLHMARAFAPVLKQNGGGAFIQLNSVASLKNFPDLSTYCISKAAAYSATQALASLLEEQGTAVHSVHPGPIATDMGDDAGLTEIAEPPELVGEAIVAALASGEFHVYPDSMAKQMGDAYQSFAQGVIEADSTVG